MAFAALGAAEVLQAHPGHVGARKLLADAVAAVRPTRASRRPGRPVAVARAAPALRQRRRPRGARPGGPPARRGRPPGRGSGAARVAARDRDPRRSPVGRPGGRVDPRRAPSRLRPAAHPGGRVRGRLLHCVRVTGDERWLDGVERAYRFLGDNDTGVSLYDPSTGGSFDGLEADGRNANQGAESTLALISTRNARAHRTTRPCLRPAADPGGHHAHDRRADPAPRHHQPLRSRSRRSPAESRAWLMSWSACSTMSDDEVDDVMAVGRARCSAAATATSTRCSQGHYAARGPPHRPRRLPVGRPPAAARRLLHPGVRGRGRRGLQPVDRPPPGSGRPGRQTRSASS